MSVEPDASASARASQPDTSKDERTPGQATSAALASPGGRAVRSRAPDRPTARPSANPAGRLGRAATTHYDAIVLGGGMAGVPLALRLGYKGLRTALIERAELGGTCLNRGCIPTKAMIASARVAHQAFLSEQWGITTGDVRVDLGRVVDRKDELVTSIRSGSEQNVAENRKVSLIRGDACFTGERALTVNGERLTADRVFVAVGTRNDVPPIEGVDEVPFLDSTSALHLRTIPPSLVIVGGGYIGVEFAQMYRRFGSDVTILQHAGQLLVAEDEDVAQTLLEALEAEGIQVVLNARVQRAERRNEGVRVTAHIGDKECPFEGTDLMIAAGRIPNTDRLGLENAGVELDAQGFITTNGRLESTAAGVWALGDVRGGPMFTHTARDDARIIYQNVMKGQALSTEHRIVPWAIFTDPQLGRVGLTEREARAAGYKLKIGTYEARKVAKARALDETRGMIKVVADAGTDRLLGAAVLMAEGAELVHEFVTALQLGAKYTDLQDMIHIHPTLAEGLNNALGGVHYEQGLE